jgi:conjugative transposon TraK protein
MAFKILENIESSFKQIRVLMLVYTVMCTILTVVAISWAFSFAEKQREKIYVLDQGRSLMVALSQDMNQNRPVEAREHVKRFHEFFFTLSPDKKAIESNIERAFFLSDKSAYQYYIDLYENGYYERMISANISQFVEFESIECDFNTHPYLVKVKAKQVIIRESSVTERILITTCQLRNSIRSDNSPHGFIIEKFKVMDNKDIKTYER